MVREADLLQHARDRAHRLRPGYRSAGVWSAEPLDVVRTAAARHPNRLALIGRDQDLSFAQLDQRIDAACGRLAEAGIGASSPVLLVAANTVESVVAAHAVLRMDAQLLLVPGSTGAVQTADIAARSGAEFGVMADGSVTSTQGWGDLLWVGLPESSPAAPVPRQPRRAADDPALVLYTSGTTSRPKGVIHSLSTLTTAASNYICAAGLDTSDRILLISPLASVTGVLQALFIGPMLAVPVVLEDSWEPTDTAELLLSTGATWYGGPDRLLDRLLSAAAAQSSVVPLRAVYLGGTMLDRRIVERVEDEFGIVVMRAYGSSEAPISTSGLRTDPRAVRHADDGVALAHVDLRVGSAADANECCIRGPHVFLGYTDAQDDAAAFEQDWFRTGDVAELTDGRVRIVGRIKDIVIRNGLKIPSGEVEDAIERIAGIRECAAYSVPDPTTGERLAVALVLEPGIDLTLADVTSALLSAGLPKYKLPEELVLWDRPLPVNANGKVLRNQLGQAGRDCPRLLADRLLATR